MTTYTETVRTARKQHHCKWGDCRTIQPGEQYLECKEFPGGEAGYASHAGRPVRMAVCADCAGGRLVDGRT